MGWLARVTAIQPFSPSFNRKRGDPMQPVKLDTPKLAYSIREACAASSLGRTNLYSQISSGRLRAVRVGGRTLIPAESLHALIAGEAA